MKSGGEWQFCKSPQAGIKEFFGLIDNPCVFTQKEGVF
jgi:hypothetical protein